MPDNPKPARHFEEMICPWSKADDLLDYFREYSPVRRTNADPGYDFLADEECTIVFQNPDGERSLEIELSDEFSLFFAEWHSHYLSYAWSYSEIVRHAEAILRNQSCVIVVERGDAWVGSCYAAEPKKIDSAYIRNQFYPPRNLPEKFQKQIDFTGCIANMHFWDSTRDFRLIMDG